MLFQYDVATEAHNAEVVAKHAAALSRTMLPGIPGYIEMQQLGVANSLRTNKEEMFIQQVLNIGAPIRVPVTELLLQSTLGAKTHCLEICAVGEHVATNYPEKFLAGFSLPQEVAFRRRLVKFWCAFQRYYPNHPVYRDHGHHLYACLPVKIHSDEGAGLRRAGAYQFSWGPVSHSDLSSRPRYFFWSCVNLETYKKAHGGFERGNTVLDELCEHFAKQLADVYWNGIDGGVLGKTYLVTISHEGDLPAQARAHHVKRNFNCAPNEMCPWCLANDSAIPYTDIREQAAWRETVSKERPWTNPSPFHIVPGGAHESFLAKDFFHTCHLGAVRAFSVNLLCFLVAHDVFAP